MMVEQLLEKIRSGKESKEELAQLKQAFADPEWPELGRMLESEWNEAAQATVTPRNN